MKIIITSQGQGLNAEVDARFGRAKGFVVYDTESKEVSYLDNEQNLQAMQGAGIQSARTIIDSGVKAIITGNVGPKAFTALQSGGVEIFIGAVGTVQKAIDDYINGNLKKADNANVEGHW